MANKGKCSEKPPRKGPMTVKVSGYTRNQNELSERDILESFASLIDSGYINGHYLWETKSGPVFSIEGITPEGLKLLD